jgi:hypothetical protein
MACGPQSPKDVAAFDWDLDRIRLLLREVSSAMADEVDHLQALPERRTGAAVR